MENGSQFSALFNRTISSVLWFQILVAPPLPSFSLRRLCIFFLAHLLYACVGSEHHQHNSSGIFVCSRLKPRTADTTANVGYFGNGYCGRLIDAVGYHTPARSVYLTLPSDSAHFQCNRHAGEFHKYVYY